MGADGIRPHAFSGPRHGSLKLREAAGPGLGSLPLRVAGQALPGAVQFREADRSGLAVARFLQLREADGPLGEEEVREAGDRAAQ